MAIIILTAVLAGITAYYAWQTKQTVDELRRARGAALLPKVALSIHMFGGGSGSLDIVNVGPGPALEVQLVVDYGPGIDRIPWSTPLLVTGEHERFFPPQNETTLNVLVERYESIGLFGTCKDALGATHQIEESLPLRAWWETNKRAMHLFEFDPILEIKDEIEAIRKTLQKKN